MRKQRGCRDRKRESLCVFASEANVILHLLRFIYCFQNVSRDASGVIMLCERAPDAFSRGAPPQAAQPGPPSSVFKHTHTHTPCSSMQKAHEVKLRQSAAALQLQFSTKRRADGRRQENKKRVCITIWGRKTVKTNTPEKGLLRRMRREEHLLRYQGAYVALLSYKSPRPLHATRVQRKRRGSDILNDYNC